MTFVSLSKCILSECNLNFRAASRIFTKGNFWLSFSQKYCKVTLFLEKRALFCQILMGGGGSVRLMDADSFGLVLDYGINNHRQTEYKIDEGLFVKI